MEAKIQPGRISPAGFRTEGKLQRGLASFMAITGLLAPSGARAGVILPAIFSHHMVLQRSEKVPVWGKADPGEEVAVMLGNQSTGMKAGADGKWKVELNLSKAGPGPFEMVVTGKDGRITIADVVVGEVWVASGQSNMEVALKDSTGSASEIPVSANPLLREFHVKPMASRELLEDCQGEWVIAGPDTSAKFSAIGYSFAKRLQNELRLPVGLVHASLGATPAEAWISSDSLDRVPGLKAARERLWNRESPKEKVLKPDGAALVFSEQNLPPQKIAGFLFNGMINPIIPYAIRGVIWYQGEGNSGRAVQYRTTFPLLITDWRERWGCGEFPFYFCQLANFQKKQAGPAESTWAELREAQSMALNLPRTGQAVLIDIGESDNIHPLNKREAGERLARIALAQDYGRKIPSSGPAYHSMKTEGSRIRLAFVQTEGGLVASPLPAVYDVNTAAGKTAPLVRNSPDSELEGFTICGEEGKWLWANAKIDDGAVLVWSDQIDRPVAVRYAWADNPTCNLSNGSGLPASPFRTDDFPELTKDKIY